LQRIGKTSEASNAINEIKQLYQGEDIEAWTDSDEDLNNYYYLAPIDIEELLGITNIKEEIIINFVTRNVISIKGMEMNEKYPSTAGELSGKRKIAHRQYDLPSGQNLWHGELEIADTSIDVESKIINHYKDNKKVELTLTENIAGSFSRLKRIELQYIKISGETYDDYIEAGNSDSQILLLIVSNNWKAIEEFEYDNLTHTLKFNLYEEGVYYFRIANDTGSEYYITETALDVAFFNPPTLPTGMKFIPVKYVNKGTETVPNYVPVGCTIDDPDWYDYQRNGNSKWANIMLLDGTYNDKTETADYAIGEELTDHTKYGSMFVWIPRYAYKITASKNVRVQFLSDINKLGSAINAETSSATLWWVQPAFRNESRNSLKTYYKDYYSAPDIEFYCGGWDKELEGIWVAKFNTSTNMKVTPTTISDNVDKTKISNIQSIINKTLMGDGSDWVDAHLMKESEFGAMALLTYSTYGNKNIQNTVNINYCGGYNNSEFSKIWNEGKVSSSTGNPYGVYDITGDTATNPGYIISAGWRININGTAPLIKVFGDDGDEIDTKYTTYFLGGTKDDKYKGRLGGGIKDLYNNVGSVKPAMQDNKSYVLVKGKTITNDDLKLFDCYQYSLTDEYDDLSLSNLKYKIILAERLSKIEE